MDQGAPGPPKWGAIGVEQCGICSKSKVDKIIAGPNVYICQNCVGEVAVAFALTTNSG